MFAHYSVSSADSALQSFHWKLFVSCFLLRAGPASKRASAARRAAALSSLRLVARGSMETVVDAHQDHDEVLRRALHYPYERRSGSFTFVNGVCVPYQSAADVSRFHVVLAIGSNAAPEQLRRKYGNTELPVHVVPVQVRGMDVVYAALMAPYGSIPATVKKSAADTAGAEQGRHGVDAQPGAVAAGVCVRGERRPVLHGRRAGGAVRDKRVRARVCAAVAGAGDARRASPRARSAGAEGVRARQRAAQGAPPRHRAAAAAGEQAAAGGLLARGDRPAVSCFLRAICCQMCASNLRRRAPRHQSHRARAATTRAAVVKRNRSRPPARTMSSRQRRHVARRALMYRFGVQSARRKPRARAAVACAARRFAPAVPRRASSGPVRCASAPAASPPPPSHRIKPTPNPLACPSDPCPPPPSCATAAHNLPTLPSRSVSQPHCSPLLRARARSPAPPRAPASPPAPLFQPVLPPPAIAPTHAHPIRLLFKPFPPQKRCTPTSSPMTLHEDRLREMLKRAVSFDNVSAFASIPNGSAAYADGHSALAAPHDQSPAAIATKKLCIVMVGLPARGKTHIARCLERYLNWLGFSAAVFNVGNYRRMILGATQSADFFSPDNLEGRRARMELAIECMNDMLEWFSHGGMVGIYDATNSTKKRRKMVKDRLEAVGVRVLFLESLCTDPAIIEKNILETKLRSPDYKDKDPEEAVMDFKKRIQQYDKANETVDDSEKCSYIKVVNVGRQIILNDIQGFAQGKIVSFLLNSHITPRSIYLSRHGESEWNVTGQLGGDPDLTVRGRNYAKCLAEFIDSEFPKKGKELPLVWTSQLRRTRRTVEHIPSVNHSWRALNEIDAGVCEGMTYKSIAEQMPEIAGERKKDKLRYRYPGGESYVDVIYRLEPLILELERQRGPVLIVGHNAVIRAIYAYFMRKSQEECPYIDIPLHTVFKLTTRAYGAEEEIFPLEVAHTDHNRTPDSGDSDGGEEASMKQAPNPIEPLTESLKLVSVNGLK
ncbi:6-phosphofructo-2-kinase/fructose-2 6-biphosphatase 4 [Gracilaria domingensis]|nr:6-phosphofructo-2-kinase/fructose-2 6-biphosphatase 4 [Gracilaria domingensis]